MAAETRYTASLSQNRTGGGAAGWSVIFRHPQPHESYGAPGHRIRRGLGTADRAEAQAMVDALNVILADRDYWSPSARDRAERDFPGAAPVIRAFFDVLAPASHDFFAVRESHLPLPGHSDGYVRVMLLGTPGAGKTTLVRQLIGTDPKRERFPSTSAAKTTTADIEIIMRPGAFDCVVTFQPKEQVRVLVEDCVTAAVLAALDGRPDAEILRKLMEHREQKFRLSYIIGAPSAGRSHDDDDDDSADNAPDDGDEELGAEQGNPTTFQPKLDIYASSLRALAADSLTEITEALGIKPADAVGEDRDALEELLEDSLRQADPFHELVDAILEDIEARFTLLSDGKLASRDDGWPLAYSMHSDDRHAFIRQVNKFSTNNARLFGQLLTPIVQGIRVAGPFSPAWSDAESPRLVIVDGVGFGHASSVVTSLPSETMMRLAAVDAILLVDNASEPMRAGPSVILRSVVTAGYQSKLRVVFTKFDLVRGGNLQDMTARQNHVRASLDQAVGDVGKAIGRSAERALQRALDGGVFFLSDIRRVSEGLSGFTRKQLDLLLKSLAGAGAPQEKAQSIPVYDEANLVLAMQRAVQSFHEKWRAVLGLPSTAAIPKEHWTRVKALTRWVSQLNAEGYDELTPVSDLEQMIRDRVYVFLHQPVSWEPETRDPDMKELAIAAVSSEVNARLRDFALRRVISQRYQDWAAAFSSHSGSGSTRRRARAIDELYDVAAPIPGEAADAYGNEFLREVRALVRDAVRAAGGKMLESER